MGALYNLARVSTPTVGTGTITLGPAVAPFLTFALAGAVSGTVSYAIADYNSALNPTVQTGSEIGTGTYNSATLTLTRNVTKSSNNNLPLNLSGNAQVYITPRAEDILQPVNPSTLNAVPHFTNTAGVLGDTGVTIDGNNNVAVNGLLVNSNTSTPQAPTLAGTIVQIANANSTANRVLLDSYAAGSALDIRRANGTAASPTALLSGQTIGTITWSGRAATAYATNARASIGGLTAENWTDTAQGTAVVINTTPVGTTTSTERIRVTPSGGLNIGGTADVPTGMLKLVATVVGSLPSAATAGAGARSFVTDANAATFASIVASGGANGVPVYSDGSNWRIG